MAIGNRILTATNALLEAAKHVEEAEAKVTSAQQHLAAAHVAAAGAAPADLAAAEQRSRDAATELVNAVKSLAEKRAQLAQLIDRQASARLCGLPPLFWCIVGGLITVSVVFLVLAGVGRKCCAADRGVWIACTTISFWIGVVAAMMVLGLLIVVALCRRGVLFGGAGGAASLASTPVTAAMLAAAAQRVIDAEAAVAAAQLDAKEKRRLAAGVTDENDERLRNSHAAQDKLEEEKDKLQVEQQQLALLCQLPAGAGSGTLSLNYLVFGVLALIALCFLMYGIFNRELLPLLASVAVSRGLITFLIAVVTVVIALILVLATVVSESADRPKRFSQGKEVLTMLIGVLGTIVGFYFGNTQDATRPMLIAAPVVTPAQPTVGEKINITSFVSGGHPPYSFELTSMPPLSTPNQKGQTADGWMKWVDLPTDKLPGDKDTDVAYEIKITDADTRPASYKGSLTIKAKAGTSAGAKPDQSTGKSTSNASGNASESPAPPADSTAK